MNIVKKSQSESKSGRVKNLLEYLYEIQEQVSFSEFESEEKKQVRELCLIIAEVMKLPDTYDVKINGEKLPASIVKDVFALIEISHICHVLENFSKLSYTVNHTKTYLRTALYNSVFEVQNKLENEVNRWMKNDK